MKGRFCFPAAAALAVLAAVACDGTNAFLGDRGVIGLPDPQAGNIRGQVTADGVGLGAVRVVVTGVDSTSTDAGGEFRFDSIPSGTYQVAVRVPLGFSLAAGEQGAETVTLTGGETEGVDFALVRNPGTNP